TVYRARLGQQPAGVVFSPITATGYSGKILLAVGISHDGTLLGIHVIAHKETAGLGDRIEPAKSGWITNFIGRSFANLPPASWAVRADGGTFDQLSGATITSRGVINAVRKVLDYFQAHRDRLYLEHKPERSS
ncbi:MAG: RnfABCDGE type electron transport complex subunit G, partial [Gammaproteobacteria bacterium]